MSGFALVIILFISAYLVFMRLMLLKKQVHARNQKKRLKQLDLNFNLDEYLKGLGYLSALYQYAKQRGVTFEINPDSVRYGRAHWGWYCRRYSCLPSAIIGVPIDLGTKTVLPENHSGQKLTLAHEIGHSLTSAEFPVCPFRLTGDDKCLYRELLAWLLALKILKGVEGINSLEEDFYKARIRRITKGFLRGWRRRCVPLSGFEKFPFIGIDSGVCPKRKQVQNILSHIESNF